MVFPSLPYHCRFNDSFFPRQLIAHVPDLHTQFSWGKNPAKSSLGLILDLPLSVEWDFFFLHADHKIGYLGKKAKNKVILQKFSILQHSEAEYILSIFQSHAMFIYKESGTPKIESFVLRCQQLRPARIDIMYIQKYIVNL